MIGKVLTSAGVIAIMVLGGITADSAWAQSAAAQPEVVPAPAPEGAAPQAGAVIPYGPLPPAGWYNAWAAPYVQRYARPYVDFYAPPWAARRAYRAGVPVPPVPLPVPPVPPMWPVPGGVLGYPYAPWLGQPPGQGQAQPGSNGGAYRPHSAPPGGAPKAPAPAAPPRPTPADPSTRPPQSPPTASPEVLPAPELKSPVRPAPREF